MPGWFSGTGRKPLSKTPHGTAVPRPPPLAPVIPKKRLMSFFRISEVKARSTDARRCFKRFTRLKFLARAKRVVRGGGVRQTRVRGVSTSGYRRREQRESAEEADGSTSSGRFCEK